MSTRYVDHLMAKKAKYERIERNKTYFGSIRGALGVWATAPTRKACEKELREVLKEWHFLKLQKLHAFSAL